MFLQENGEGGGLDDESISLFLSVVHADARQKMTVEDFQDVYGSGGLAMSAIWCYDELPGDPSDATVGDYGYLDAKTRLFVCLGNIFRDLWMTPPCFDWSASSVVDNHPHHVHWDYDWRDAGCTWMYAAIHHIYNSSDVATLK